MPPKEILAMRTVRVKAEITMEHELRARVPDDLPVGQVDVTLELNEASENAGDAELWRFLDRVAASPRRTRTKAEIDRYIQQERGNWE
jgi:hypothetical protein